MIFSKLKKLCLCEQQRSNPVPTTHNLGLLLVILSLTKCFRKNSKIRDEAKRKIRRISGYFENFSQSRSPNFWIIRKGFFRDGISTPSQRQKIEFRNSKYKNILATIFLLASFLFFGNVASASIAFQTPGAIAYSTSGGTSVSPAYPASIAANDLLVLIVGMKPSTANSGSVTTPTGWVADASLVGAGGYGTTLGGDTGNTNIFAFYKVAVGTETGSLSVSIATNNISWTQIYRFSNTTGVWNISGTTGSDTTGNTSVSIAMSANPGVSALDFILGAMVIPTDVSTPSQFSGEALSQTGVTFGAVTEISEPDSNTGNDIGGVTYYAPVTAGTASSVPTFTATAGGTVTNVRGPGIFIRIRELITTTLATGTDPSATTIAPGAAATDVNQFTLQTNSGTETISSVTVNLSTNSGVGLLAITDNANNVLGSTASPVTGSNTISVVGMSAGTTITTFKVRVTPLSHTTMPAPAGGQYSVTAPVTSWASSTTHAGSDTNANALTIDNLSPAGTTGATATPGDAQVSLSWTNPADADFSNVVILRDTATIGSGSTPTEGTSPIVGSSCGGTLCQVRYILSGTSLVDTGLTNGTTYFYRIFTKDTRGNYTAFASTQQVSATPTAAPVTTIADGGAGTNATVAPGSGIVDLDNFTLQTSTGSDTVTALTVTLLPANAFSNIAQVDITDNSNLVRCTAVVPTSNTVNFTTCTSNGGVTAVTSATTYKVRITPLSHSAMPAPAVGASYATTGTVSSFTSTNAHSGTDTGSATVTIDNLSPAATTGATATPGDAQVSLSWTNPADADFSNVVILRDTATIGSGSTPTEGTSPIVGSSCGGTLCQVRYILSGTSLVDTGLTNGTTYFYRIFTKDTNGNYSAVGTVPTGSPSTPSPTAFNIVATSGANGTVAPSGTTAVAQGNSQAYTITPDSGYGVATLVVDSVSIATSNTYTFTNVQAGHTISATFSILPITHTITSSVGSNGTISPLGATLVASSSSQTYTITPNTGFIVATLVVDSVSIATSTSYTFTNVIANHTISATFSLIPPPPGSFTIIATSGANGTVSPSGSIVVTQGNSQPYTITPDTGYYIGTLIIDSSLVATSTTYTFTNVQANHTIEATFVSSPVAPTVIIDTGTSRPTTITFLGTAFPGGKVSILNKELRSEEIVGQEVLAGTDGSFSISFVGILQGLHSFGLIVKDKEGRTSQTKFFLVDTRSDGFMEKDILVPPTIDTANGQVSRGSNAIIYGYASPNHSISLSIDGILVKETPAEKDGSYKFEIPTGPFNFGQHSVKTKQISSDKKRESDFSISRTFIVSQLSVVKADFSGDGKIDIKDWSIFLFRWSTKNATARESIDLNSDGKVDITDFSIFIKTIRKI